MTWHRIIDDVVRAVATVGVAMGGSTLTRQHHWVVLRADGIQLVDALDVVRTGRTDTVLAWAQSTTTPDR